MNKKLFLDTDIGDDIDDALALIMLLKMNQCDIVGISTVFANTPLRTRLTNKILSLMNRRDINVYSGVPNPISYEVDIKRSFVQYSDELLNDEYKPINDAFTDNGQAAIDALIDSAKKYQEDLTILAIGPYTNICKAIMKDKEAFRKVKIVLMGGCFYEQFVEYNVAMDPEAADYIFKSGLDIRIISADVTWLVQLDDNDTNKILNTYSSDITGYSAELVRMWKSNCWFNPVLHDPLAAYYVIDNSICEMESIWTEVELNGSITRGMTPNRDHFLKYLEHKLDKPRVLCSKSVNKEKFINEFMNIMFK